MALFSIFFVMTKVAVGILRMNGKILACQRKRGSKYELKWEFPGGKVEPGETFAQCIERELFEELSIRVTRIEEIEIQQSHYNDGGLYEVAYCTITEFKGNLRNNVFELVKWVTPAELAQLDSLEGNAAIVRKLAGQNATADAKNR
ncbi:MAG: (deoxy)nucleoside triphosphate pyrophosphohydrolase [Bacteroidota bacterium]